MSKENELKSRFEDENNSVFVFKYSLTGLMSREIRPIDFPLDLCQNHYPAMPYPLWHILFVITAGGGSSISM